MLHMIMYCISRSKFLPRGGAATHPENFLCGVIGEILTEIENGDNIKMVNKFKAFLKDNDYEIASKLGYEADESIEKTYIMKKEFSSQTIGTAKTTFNLIEKMDKYRTGPVFNFNTGKSQYEIDHLYPKSRKNEDPDIKDYVNRIGNLNPIPMSINRSAQNNEWEDKRTLLKESTQIPTFTNKILKKAYSKTELTSDMLKKMAEEKAKAFLEATRL